MSQQANPLEWDTLDTSLLSDATPNHQGGKGLYALYIKMWKDKDGWWWSEDTYGKDGFTIWEFLAIQLGLEQDLFPRTDNYSAALANNAADWSARNGCSVYRAECALNWLAAYSYRPHPGVYDCVQDRGCDIETKVRMPLFFSTAMTIVQAIRYRPSVNLRPIKPNDLYTLGNLSLAPDVLGMMIKRGMVFTAWGEGNTAIILTQCQAWLYWAAMQQETKKDRVGFINRRNYSAYCG